MWSWILFALAFVILFATWQIGSGKRWAWLLMVATNIPWLVFGLTTNQYGFVATSVLYTVVQGRNWLHERD